MERINSILKEVASKYNSYSNAHVINTRCKEVIEIISHILPKLSEEQVKSLKNVISELDKIPILLKDYSSTVDYNLFGNGFKFTELSNAAYNAIESALHYYPKRFL